MVLSGRRRALVGGVGVAGVYRSHGTVRASRGSPGCALTVPTSRFTEDPAGAQTYGAGWRASGGVGTDSLPPPTRGSSERRVLFLSVGFKNLRVRIRGQWASG